MLRQPESQSSFALHIAREQVQKFAHQQKVPGDWIKGDGHLLHNRRFITTTGSKFEEIRFSEACWKRVTIFSTVAFMHTFTFRLRKKTSPSSVQICPLLPFAGSSFKLNSIIEDRRVILKPVCKGRPGPNTQEWGKLAYFEIYGKLANNRKHFTFPTFESVLSGDEYFVFGTLRSLGHLLPTVAAQKPWYCTGSWQPEWDDFSGHRGLGSYPLLKTLHKFEVELAGCRLILIKGSDIHPLYSFLITAGCRDPAALNIVMIDDCNSSSSMNRLLQWCR